MPPVRSVGDHGVERVGNSENARSQWNLFSLQTSRIARTIKIFLMGKHNLRSLPEEWNSSDHVKPNFAMSAHDLTLFGRERSWLAQDHVWYSHLPISWRNAARAIWGSSTGSTLMALAIAIVKAVTRLQ